VPQLLELTNKNLFISSFTANQDYNDEN